MKWASFRRPAARLTPIAAVAGLLFVALPSASGQESPPDVDCRADRRDPTDLGQTAVEWVYKDGSPTARVEVRAADRVGVVYRLEGRVHFGDTDVTWSQGPYEIEGLDTEAIDVTIPTGAKFSEAQADYVSELVVRLVAVDEGTGDTVERMSAPRVRLVWEGGTDVLLMDAALAADLAPDGVFRGGAASAPVEENEDGYVYEYASR